MPIEIEVEEGEKVYLTDATLRRIALVTDETHKAERGFALCQIGDKVLAGREHVGGRYSISFKDCGKWRKRGHFHTHPGTDSFPSWGDGYAIVFNSRLHNRFWIGCRGGEDRKIRCETLRRMPTEEEVKEVGRHRKRYQWRRLDVDDDLVRLVKTVLEIPVELGSLPKIHYKPRSLVHA